MTADTKTKQEIQKEHEEARAELEAYLNQTRPKNLREGTLKGFSNILAGAIGGAGIAVLAPTAGFAAGLERGGLVGGVLGAAGGAVVGVVGAAGLILGGAVSGVTQVVRGIAAVPEAVAAPKQGKWWNENTHQWVYTDLSKVSVPDSDEDMLESLEAEADYAAGSGGTSSGTGSVKDTHYYEILKVDPNAEAGAIKRKYYVLAREYHPDKNPAPEAAEKFKEIAEAYQILSDPKLREKYDQEGKDALKADELNADNARPDPSLLMAFLFGSDKFNDYFGRLATSTSAMLGDPKNFSVKDAQKLQERRVTRLALKLVEKIEPWIKEDYDFCKVQWKTEADELVKASYGWELIQALGMAYEVAAVQFLGSLESGLGLPSISKWAKGQHARQKGKKASRKNQSQTLMAGFDAMKIQAEYQQRIEKASSDQERVQLQHEMEDAAQEVMLKVVWTTTIVDITSTVHEVCQMVFFDQSVDKDARKRRAAAVKDLGEIFQATPEPPADSGTRKSARAMFEEAALAATVETMKRKDEAAHKASYGGS